MFPFVSNTREVEIRPQHHWSRRAGSVCAAAACASFQGVARQRNAVRLSNCRSPLKPTGGQRDGEKGRKEGGGGRGVSSPVQKFLAAKPGHEEWKRENKLGKGREKLLPLKSKSFQRCLILFRTRHRGIQFHWFYRTCEDGHAQRIYYFWCVEYACFWKAKSACGKLNARTQPCCR